MAVYHVKRIRMRRPLAGWMPSHDLPAGFTWQRWDQSLTDTHAGVMFLSFANSIDAELFPNLGSLSGCRMLVRWLQDFEGFCPQATWLLNADHVPIGTVQGAIEDGLGSIQNIGVIPEFRKRGLGRALVAKALDGFRNACIPSATLEVSANNPNALRLYRRLGFRTYNSFLRRIERLSS